MAMAIGISYGKSSTASFPSLALALSGMHRRCGTGSIPIRLQAARVALSAQLNRM
jgi:hypothetical protein